jgi:hypothetical protein
MEVSWRIKSKRKRDSADQFGTFVASLLGMTDGTSEG